MKVRKLTNFKILCIAAALLLGQLVYGEGLAQSGQAGYQDWLPLVSKYLGYRESIGVLDPSFGEGGIVLTPLAGYYAVVYGLALQPDGKIVAIGPSALLRYLPDGSLDTSFDGDGIVMFDNYSSDYTGSAVALQPDGKILVAGQGKPPNQDFGSGFSLVRYHANGSLDTSFGTAGHVFTDFGGLNDGASAVMVQPDGKIIVGGGTDFIYTNSNFALARYNTDGTLDKGFGSGGMVTLDFYGVDDYGSILALQPDGKILVAGTAGDCPYACFALARYNPDGSLDPSFGTNGWVTADIEDEHDPLVDMLLQPDGKILLAGDANSSMEYYPYWAAVRYHPDGVLDLGLGVDGKLITDWGAWANVYALALQPDGKFLIGGYADNGLYYGYALARYNPDGSLDETFGQDGKLITELAGGIAYAMAIQADGKIILAGTADAGDQSAYALVRYK